MDKMNLNSFLQGIKGKSIGIVGLGVSNVPLLDLLVSNGISVSVHDKSTSAEFSALVEKYSSFGVKFNLGPSYLEHLDYDIVFRTPGMHPSLIKDAIRKDTIVTSEMEVFFSVCPCHIIAITGSDGKTTTSTLIAKLLEEEGFTVHLGGNIGRPLLADSISFSQDDYAVVELSSFQLHGMHCCPEIAVITNVSPNHLDVHPSFEDYQSAKMSIFLYQDENCKLVLNKDNEFTSKYAQYAKSNVVWFSQREIIDSGFYFYDNAIYHNGKLFLEQNEILLPGMHNVENYMAAFAATDGLVSRETCKKIANTFTGVSHRIELVRTYNGIKYYNDSIASSPTRTIACLHSFDQKLILIAGGHDKKVSFDLLAKEINDHVKALFLVGETAETIKNSVLLESKERNTQLPIFLFDDFKETVLAASSFASYGDIIVLSPACSSFDLFKNFVERGNTFRQIVEEL